MSKTKIREITLDSSQGVFNFFSKSKTSKGDFDFSGLLTLRQLLNNEKARLLYTIKEQKPKSIYELAKKLNRNFKAVSDDVKFLKKMGFIELNEEKTKKRIRHKPSIVVDTITFNFKV